MKVILEFDKFEESEELDDALNGTKYRAQVEEMWNVLFRPLNKHGYPDERLNELCDVPEVREAIELLADKYRGIISED